MLNPVVPSIVARLENGPTQEPNDDCNVDEMRAAYSRMVMCHMIADTDIEPHAIAAAIGVASAAQNVARAEGNRAPIDVHQQEGN